MDYSELELMSLTEAEARHLALWLRDNGFLDDGAVESTCRHCSGVVRCFNHDCEGTPP
jgi:hypothetical protein